MLYLILSYLILYLKAYTALIFYPLEMLPVHVVDQTPFRWEFLPTVSTGVTET